VNLNAPSVVKLNEYSVEGQKGGEDKRILKGTKKGIISASYGSVADTL